MKERADTAGLAERRILVVEDIYFLAADVAAALSRAGARVVGPAPTCARALSLIEATPLDGAVLNICLKDGDCYPAADALQRRGTPFIFVTGFDLAALPARFAWVPLRRKPTSGEAVVDALAAELRKLTRAES